MSGARAMAGSALPVPGRALLIAAPQSGSGKTTVALAVMASLAARGLRVAPYKCGPDFIDPGYHRLACGRPSINLDSWMCPEEFVRDTFALHAAGADLAVIEGAMGLFDGLGASRSGSSAQVAAVTGAPVVLVLNARGMAASVVPLVKGFLEFDPRVRLAGVIFNNVGSSTHADLLRTCLAQALPEVAVFGCIPRQEDLEIRSRHLGLVTAEDNPLSAAYLERLIQLAETHLDLDGLSRLTLAQPFPAVPPPGYRQGGEGPRIAVARDAAFCFVYEDNLRLLREAGAELEYFSPLEDAGLPPGVSGLYLPGGYPELHAPRLAANTPLLEGIRAFVAAGGAVYAECGGFMYLTEGVVDGTGQNAPLAGIFATHARMLPRRKALGYRQVTCTTATPIGPEGMMARGHEFHYSEIGPLPPAVRRCYRVSRPDRELDPEGYRVGNCLASYIHLHFGSNPLIAPAFVEACRRGV